MVRKAPIDLPTALQIRRAQVAAEPAAVAPGLAVPPMADRAAEFTRRARARPAPTEAPRIAALVQAWRQHVADDPDARELRALVLFADGSGYIGEPGKCRKKVAEGDDPEALLRHLGRADRNVAVPVDEPSELHALLVAEALKQRRIAVLQRAKREPGADKAAISKEIRKVSASVSASSSRLTAALEVAGLLDETTRPRKKSKGTP